MHAILELSLKWKWQEATERPLRQCVPRNEVVHHTTVDMMTKMGTTAAADAEIVRTAEVPKGVAVEAGALTSVVLIRALVAVLQTDMANLQEGECLARDPSLLWIANRRKFSPEEYFETIYFIKFILWNKMFSFFDTMTLFKLMTVDFFVF